MYVSRCYGTAVLRGRELVRVRRRGAARGHDLLRVVLRQPPAGGTGLGDHTAVFLAELQEDHLHQHEHQAVQDGSQFQFEVRIFFYKYLSATTLYKLCRCPRIRATGAQAKKECKVEKNRILTMKKYPYIEYTLLQQTLIECISTK